MCNFETAKDTRGKLTGVGRPTPRRVSRLVNVTKCKDDGVIPNHPTRLWHR